MKQFIVKCGFLFTFMSFFPVILPGSVQAVSVGSLSSVFIFGDSLSDSGNVSIATGGAIQTVPHGGLIPSLAYSGGRFSNGPVWVELLAASLGNGALPSMSGGTDFAFGGARTGPSGATPLASPTLLDQLGMFSLVTGGIAPADALYIAWGGANDVRDAARLRMAGDDQGAIDRVDMAVANIEGLVAGLGNMGAVDILVPNIPDLGVTPEALRGGPSLSQSSSILSNEFNTRLDLALDGVAARSGINIIEMDIFGLVASVINSPSDFGLTYVSEPCVDSGSVCMNPGEYLFYDGIHPTAAGHEIVAQFAMQHVIPEPKIAFLLATAIILFSMHRYSSIWRRRVNRLKRVLESLSSANVLSRDVLL